MPKAEESWAIKPATISFEYNPDVDDDGHEVIDVSAYVLRRNAASRWLNIDGLTHDEIDMLLGHKRKITGGPELYLTDETHQQSIAKKLERYIYNPQHTGNPIFAPVEINAETRKFDLIPFPVSRIKNTDSKPILVRIDAENAEPGEVLSFIFPKGAVVSRNASRSVKWKGKEENVIGSNSDSFEEVEVKDGS